MNEWWKKNNKKIPYCDSNFNSIFQFYVYECPVQYTNGSRVSARATTFEEAGINGNSLTKMISELKRKMNKDAKYDNILDIRKVEDVVSGIEKKRGRVEFAVFKPDSNLGATRTLYYFIRNAFAHGSFSIVYSNNQERYYYFENARNNEIRGRFCVSERTLLKWMDYTKSILKKQ